MSELKVINVIAGLHPRHGGPSVCVPRLCAALLDVGCNALIHAVEEAGSPPGPSTAYHPQDFARMPILNRLRFSGDLSREVLAEAKNGSVIHSHGLWLMPNVYAGWAAKKAKVPLIVSGHGMLASQALLHNKRVKRIFWSIVQGPSYRDVAVWHATSAAEAEAIRQFGIRGPIAIIRNGVDIPRTVALHSADSGSRTLLFLSRVHPHKGIAALIRAWSVVAPLRPDWNLVIAGQGHRTYRAEMEELASSLGTTRVDFVGPVAGLEKEHLFQKADLFILPSKSENFGLVVAEALAAGVPAIVSKGAPWSDLELHQCGWWTDAEPGALAATLLRATALSSQERRSMGELGRAWMTNDFGWAAVAGDMIKLYRWMLSKGPRPDFVR